MKYSRPFRTGLAVYLIYIAVEQVLGFALPLLAFDLTGAGLDLSLIRGAAFIPNILFAIFIGALNDRIRKATGYRIYSLLLAVIVLALLAALVTGRVSVAGLMVFMIVFNTAGYALGNAQSGLVRLTVEKPHLSDAVSLASGLGAVIATAAPALAGFALYRSGHSPTVAVAAGLLVLSFLLSLRLEVEETPPPAAPIGAFLAEGVRALAANRELVRMTIVIVLTNAAEGVFSVALLFRLKAELGASETAIGLVLAAAGAGAALAAAFAARLRRRLGYRAAFFWPIWILMALYLLVAQVHAPAPLAVLSFADGAVALFFAIGIWSYRQESVEPAHMSRVAGLTGAIFKLAMPPAMAFGGFLADWQGAQQVFYLAVALHLLAALYLSQIAGWGWPGLRKTAAGNSG